MVKPEINLNIQGCYLIHADSKIHHAQHYVGYADCIKTRIKSHRQGHGSKLVRAFNEKGIAWHVARVWPDTDRAFERRLHNQNNSPRLCPICKGKNHEIRPL